MAAPLVWTEREGGDWEACVISSYLIGLVYGGFRAFPLGIYTQAEREALEKVADEPQDYYTTDAMAQTRYGVQLRKLSTGSIPDAVTRVGVGLVLAGYGALLIPTAASIHSVFYLPTSATAGLVFDPLAVNQSAGVPIPASRIVAWSKGAGPNDAREVKENEFAAAPGGTDLAWIDTIKPLAVHAEIPAGVPIHQDPAQPALFRTGGPSGADCFGTLPGPAVNGDSTWLAYCLRAGGIRTVAKAACSSVTPIIAGADPATVVAAARKAAHDAAADVATHTLTAYAAQKYPG